MTTNKTFGKGLSNEAINAIAGRYYLPFGCGIDHEDLVQEAHIAALSVEGRGNGYTRRSVHNALGMIIERERAQKRLPADGYHPIPETESEAHGAISALSGHIKAADSDPEGEVYVTQVLGMLSPRSREVIQLRMDPRPMAGYYEKVDRPIPRVPSYADISRHLGVSVGSVMLAIKEAQRLVLSDA
jgi:DNA-directed RNA polymerase specialized sigma24 family protein